ncbi:MAG: hypothetical protein MUF52_08320 [Syntrophobacteraceae bacterium]|nr:hypothetical protein [Syntrophobacteraceae bacterium]
MISDGNKRHGLATISLLLMLTLFPVLDPAAAEQTDDSEGPPLSTGESPDFGEVYNHYARFIAGMPVPGGELAALQKKPAWVEYSRYLDRSWSSLNKRLLIPERQWAEKELGAAASWEGSVFYPFSGPDFANVHAFFPRSRTYVLVALETLGEIPRFAGMSDGQLKSYFESMKNSLRDLLNINYFISSHMDAEIEKTEIKGVLPVLLFKLARSNAQVLDVRYWTMGMDGNVREFPALGTTAREFPALGARDLDLNNIPGIRITFRTPASRDAAPQTLYYFRLDLSNGSFDRNPSFLAFLKGLAPFTTFMKSASYVMSSDKVSAARELMLDQSRYIVQEDSGIPLKYFEPSLWSLRFHGRYVRPISAFSQKYQKDLASVYRSDKKIKPLPFGFGYYFNPGEANLMFGEKRSGDRGRDEAPDDHSDDKHFLYINSILQRQQRGS